MNTRERLVEMYFDWVNNFISIDKFAEYHNLHRDEAMLLLDVARKLAYADSPESIKLDNLMEA
jgi:hypothetical protein